ncbi:hypothetical protein NW768_007646 [Fusarium equiseti]|uniref:Uncharacterized protein n=1 Tax=Fusarium equiseti TaxID=61235 RepID=A0ABQ8R8Q3_FUSEQ|nr:hypothetical protein NW768_007646 [Fusarium equiseti]
MVQVQWNGQPRSDSFSAKTRMQLYCQDFIDDERPMPLPVNSSRVSMALLDDDIGELPALSTLRLKAQIESNIFADAPCIASLMTPAVPPAISSGLRYGSLAIFLFVFFVSVVRTIAAVPGLQHGTNDNVPSTATVLPSVSDCLHFLQFVFLTGGLSLSYPGFYPAAVGHLNWFALFADLALPIRSFVPAPIGLVRMASTYPGVRDGLYEVNGTYGSYPGLEVMTQMVGAPMTCDTWLLMLCFIVSIAALLGLFLWLLETLRPRNVLGLPLLGPRHGMSLAMRIGNGVLKLVLSYITLPLVAMSVYQFYFSGSLGAGHVTLTVVVLILILLAFVWLAVRLPSESLGALVFEAKLRYQHVGADGVRDLEEEKQTRREHGYVMVLFVLNIVRGLTIGGLQNWGVLQLAILVTCELVMLVAVHIFRPYPLLSVGFATTLLRLAILACFVPFVFSPSKMLGTKSVTAYIALALYAVGLLGIYFASSCWHLYRLTQQHWNIEKDAPVFNLRQLQRREMPIPSPTDETLPSDRNFIIPRHGRPCGNEFDLCHGVTTHGFNQSTSSLNSRFYRPPRSPIPTAPGEISRLFEDRSHDSDVSSSSIMPSTADCSSSSTDSEGLSDQTAGQSLDSVSLTSSAEASRPLGPRWGDYSFREVDLIFATPPPQPSVTTSPPQLASASSPRVKRRLLDWRLLSWWSFVYQHKIPDKTHSLEMPPIIHCVRHGQGVHNLSYANHDLPDPELTLLGEEQARALTTRFPELANVELIVSSPLQRTIQTALLAFPSKLEGGMQILALAEVQEASELICDTGSPLPDIRAKFNGLPVDFSLVEPDWHVKQGKWAPIAACLLERAKLARRWLSERPESEIVVISHGCFLHFLTDDWVNAVNPQATDWANAEVRSFTLASDKSGGYSLEETEGSRKKRGCEQLSLTNEQQLELRDAVLKTWIEWGVIKG